MCHFSSYWEEGVPAIRGIIYCVFMTWKRGTRPLCSLQRESWKTFFPPFPPVSLHFHLPNGGCALTFAGINLLAYLDFPSLICLNEINGHSCGQIYREYPLFFFFHSFIGYSSCNIQYEFIIQAFFWLGIRNNFIGLKFAFFIGANKLKHITNVNKLRNY